MPAYIVQWVTAAKPATKKKRSFSEENAGAAMVLFLTKDMDPKIERVDLVADKSNQFNKDCIVLPDDDWLGDD